MKITHNILYIGVPCMGKVPLNVSTEAIIKLQQELIRSESFLSHGI